MLFSFLPFDNCISGILYLIFEEKIYLSKNITAKKGISVHMTQW